MTTARGGSDRAIWSLFAAPGSVLLILFFALPMALVVVFSFGTVDLLGQPVLGASLENYRQVLQPHNLAPLWRTLEFTVVATLLCIVLGYPVAYLLGRHARRAAPVVIGVIVLTWLVDYLVRIYAWQSILASNGLLAQFLGLFGLPAPELMHTDFAVIAGLVYSYLPLMILPIYAAVSELNPQVVEAAKDLFASPRVAFFRVTLPQTRDGVVGGVLLVALPMLGDFATAEFLGGPNSTMLGNLINDQFTAAGSQTVGSAFAVALIVLLLLVLGLIMLISRRGLQVDAVVTPASGSAAVHGKAAS